MTHLADGLFAVALPFTDLVDYRLEISYPGAGTAAHRGHSYRGRRLPVPADPRRGGPAPVRRGPPRTALGDPRRAPPVLHHRRRRGRRGVVRGVGAQRQGRQPDRRLQRLGRPRRPDAGARVLRCVGAVLARLLRSTACTSSGSTAPTARSPTGPTRWPSPPRSRRTPPPGCSPRDYDWDDDDWMTAAQRGKPGVRADVHLRGAPGVVAAGPELPRTRRAAHRLRCGTWLHPRRAAAGGRASVRRVVGIPGHVLLRAHVPVRHARRVPSTWSTVCTAPASG